MSVETYRVLMGTCGWKHRAWLNDFYSEDLPEDWQLGFYSNEFPVVYVPAVDWVNEENLSEWTEDVSETFRFIMEVSTELLNNESQFLDAIDKIKSLNESCLGIVFKLSQNLCNDTELLQERLLVAQTIAPVCVDTNDAVLSSDFTDFLLEHNISKVWDGNLDKKEGLNQGALAISLVSSNQLDMANLRKEIEVCLSASNNERMSVLCFEGTPPSLEILRNANIILNLL